MQQKLRTLSSGLVRIISSQYFFYAIIAYFVLNSLWFVFTSLYPMAFDEEFHLGIINIYTQSWSPFISHQPAGTEYLSGVTRDPSFLFHYVMSFPLRAVQLFTDSQFVQVIVLRLFNVAFLGSSLFIYRRLLLNARISKFTTHAALALFVLIPIVTFLGAQINYDNVMIPLTGLALTYALKLTTDWRRGAWSIKNTLILIAIMLLASVVKYVFLPLAVGIALYLLWTLYRSLKSKRLVFHSFKGDAKKVSKKTYVIFGAILLILLTFFVQRYGVNTATYGTPLPSCDQMLSIDECRSYGPWNRNYNLAQQLPQDFSPNIVQFTAEWFFGLWMRCLFTIAGLANDYENYRPLPIIGTTVIVLAVSGFIALLTQCRRVFKGQTALQLFTVMSLLYAGILFMENFSQYKETGFFVAINGRYLLPLLPLIFVVYARSFSVLFSRLHAKFLPALIGGLVLAAFLLQGGGASGWIVQSSPDWYWSNRFVESVNQTTRTIIKPFIIGERSQ